MMNIGEIIRSTRKEKKLSQRKLAEISGVSFAYIQQLEKCQKDNPSMGILKKLSQALEINIFSLLPSEQVENFEKDMKDINSKFKTVKQIADNKEIALTEYIKVCAYTNGLKLNESQIKEVLESVEDTINTKLKNLYYPQ